jgi:hypothetical protein
MFHDHEQPIVYCFKNGRPCEYHYQKIDLDNCSWKREADFNSAMRLNQRLEQRAR